MTRTNNWTPLEEAVMRLLLAGDDPVLAILREQFAHATLASRDMTGTGFYTDFAVPDAIRRVPGNPSFQFGDVEAAIPPLQAGAGFLLWISEGILNFLEGYSYEEPWPEEITIFTTGYIGGKRNTEELRKAWER